MHHLKFIFLLVIHKQEQISHVLRYLLLPFDKQVKAHSFRSVDSFYFLSD